VAVPQASDNQVCLIAAAAIYVWPTYGQPLDIAPLVTELEERSLGLPDKKIWQILGSCFSVWFALWGGHGYIFHTQ
jgi:hypothetical protein